MPLHRWPRVKALFDEAQQRPPTARGAFLDAACDDDALRREVERLLAFDAGAGAFFDTLAHGFRPTDGDADPPR